MANQPLWRSLAEVDPELAVRIERRRKRATLRFFSRLPIIRYIFRNLISQALSDIDEAGILVDSGTITPNDYQTAWAGEPGNYLRKAMGNPKRLTIRHLEEAHSAFGRPDQMSSVQKQQTTLIDAATSFLTKSPTVAATAWLLPPPTSRNSSMPLFIAALSNVAWLLISTICGKTLITCAKSSAWSCGVKISPRT